MQKCRNMQRNAKNAEKCTEMKRNIGKCREMQICRDILITFMTFVTFMKHGNVIFDILELEEIFKITRFFWENFPKPLNPLINPRDL